jgi:ABC-type branched-subunit amino acid transport system substrate-binding protein
MNKGLVLSLLCSATLAGAGVASAAEKLVVGQSVELSGEAIGKENMLGAQAYFSWLNAQGGIHGREVELRSYDDQRDPKKTLDNTERLLQQEHAIALFGYRSTPTVEAVLPLLQKEHVALVAPFSGAAALHRPFNPYVFHLRASYWDEAGKMVESLSMLQIRKVAILHQDDAFGEDGLEGFQRSLTARNMHAAVVAKYSRKTLDVGPAADAIAAANPGAVLMACTPSACADFVKRMHKKGLRPQFIMLSNVSSEHFFKSLGEDGRGIGVMQVMPYPHDVGASVTREFQRVLKTMGHPPPMSYAALEGFVAAKLLAEGLKRAGPHPSRQSLIDAMASMHDVDLGGVVVNYGPDDRDGSHFVELTVVGKGGVFWR